jgi:hypothetical protein
LIGFGVFLPSFPSTPLNLNCSLITASHLTFSSALSSSCLVLKISSSHNLISVDTRNTCLTSVSCAAWFCYSRICDVFLDNSVITRFVYCVCDELAGCQNDDTFDDLNFTDKSTTFGHQKKLDNI